MRSEDSTVPETTAHLESGHDELQRIEQLDHLAEHTDDPALRRELEASLASGQASSRNFRKAWDRFWMVIGVGR